MKNKELHYAITLFEEGNKSLDLDLFEGDLDLILEGLELHFGVDFTIRNNRIEVY